MEEYMDKRWARLTTSADRERFRKTLEKHETGPEQNRACPNGAWLMYTM
jgi:hypothetical protein